MKFLRNSHYLHVGEQNATQHPFDYLFIFKIIYFWAVFAKSDKINGHYILKTFQQLLLLLLLFYQ
jgi:hypothetical protein